MNALKIFELAQAANKDLTFTLSEGSNSEQTVFTADLFLDGVGDDEVFTKVICYDTGTVHILFVFDCIDPSLRVYELINELNDKSTWLKGYITELNGHKFFEVHYSFFDSPDEAKAASRVKAALVDITKNENTEILRKICKLTYPLE